MTKAEQIKALYRSNFSAFLRFAFRELNPKTELVETWHIDVLADYLERVSKGEITRLIINLPPRCLKSLAASIALPVWMHGRNPELKIMSIAGSRELAGDFERATQDLLRSPRCRALFPHLKPEGRGGNLYLPHGGQRISGVVGGILVGRGADLIVVDDPIAPARVHDEPRRRAVSKWFDAEVIPRLNDKDKGRVVVVMQRLHHEDLSGHLLSGEQPWVHLNLPAIATEDEEWTLSRGGVITRQKGYPLAPKIDSWVPLYRRMMDMGAYNFSAQYQQKPYVHMNDEEVRGGWFAQPDEYGFPMGALCKVPETAILAYELFGIGDRHPAMPAREMTREEWERYAVWTMDYQRRLLEDPNSKWGPPENEAALLAEYRAGPVAYRREPMDDDGPHRLT